MLRLNGGPDATSGRVEVLRNGVWDTVCDADFDDADAGVVCRQLGFSGGVARTDAYFGLGGGDILLTGLECTGDEDSVLACPRSSGLTSWCDHSEDASVICKQGTLLLTIKRVLTGL